MEPPTRVYGARGEAMRASWVTDWIQRPLLHWQQTSERNAQQAMIALAHLRREREDVERFLAVHSPARPKQDEAGRPVPPAASADRR